MSKLEIDPTELQGATFDDITWHTLTLKHEALAGHANVNTTAAYDRRGIRVQEAAAQTIHVPYQRLPD